MAGLLGNSWDDPKSMAVMQLAAGLLGGGNFGQALGRGLGGYQQTMKDSRAQKLEDELMQYKRDEFKSTAKQRELKTAFAERLNDLFTGAQEAPTINGKPVDMEALSVGPTMPDKPRYEIPQSKGRTDFNSAIADPKFQLTAKLAGYDLTDIAKLAAPNWQNINGNLVNTNASGFQGGFQPGMHITPSGQAVLTVPGRDGLPMVGAAPGSLATMGAFQQQEQEIKNRNTLLPPDYVDASSGAPIGGSVGSYLQGRTTAPSAPSGLQGLSPQDQARIMADAQKNGITNPTISPNWNYGQQAPAAPRLQSKAEAAAAEVRAREEAKTETERKAANDSKAAQFSDFRGQLQRARDLLNAGPTQSGIGALADAAGGFLGYSLPGADVASSLDAVGAWLVQNIPKAPGAQTDFELREYQKAAGAVGDRSVPVKERLAKLKEAEAMIGIWEERTQGGKTVSNERPAASAMPSLPTANASNKGRVILDQQTGQRLRSNGMQWVPE